jgi:hypothetical protein
VESYEQAPGVKEEYLIVEEFVGEWALMASMVQQLMTVYQQH